MKKRSILFMTAIASLCLTGCDLTELLGTALADSITNSFKDSSENNQNDNEEQNHDHEEDHHDEEHHEDDGGDEDQNVSLLEIQITSNNREFYKGDAFIGETVIAYFSDGSSSVVEASFNGYDMSSVGEQEVTASYTYNNVISTKTYTITVLNREVIVTAENSKYTFENNLSSDGSTEISEEVLFKKFTDGIQSGADIVTGVSETAKVYEGKNSTIKISSSKAGGKFTVNVSKNVVEVIVIVGHYDDNATLSVNGNAKNIGADFEELTYEIDSSSIVFEGAKRSYIKSIEFVTSGTGGGTTTQKTLASISVSGQKTSYSVGDDFSFNGTCTAKYSDGSSKTVTPTNVSKPDMSLEGTQVVTITYSEGGVSKTTIYNIVITKGTGGGSGDITDSDDQLVKEYYSSIGSSSSGETLKNELATLNKNKIGSKPGYDGMKTLYKNIDADPTGSGKILGFYDNALIGPSWDSGKTWNREHVWPNSLGGGSVEGDAYMPRPTAVKSNSSRGNDYYAESGAFDPGYAIPNYRGIAARIILYCAIANPNLILVDTNGSSKPNNTMGKLSDLLKWNLQYLPTSSESAAPELRCEYLKQTKIPQYSTQKNRNPFVDHPEYACKIWGNTNATTKSICGIK